MLIQHRQEIVNDEKIALAEELEQLIMPFLSRLKKDAREAKQMSLLKIIESNLQQLISSYGRATTFSQVSKKLTPKEIEIASLIRQGLSSKEIATTLSLSPETVSNHRKSIRNKLGLDSRATNLRSALLSLIE
jgi:DNA-binding NarL/FixJ family response regulator